MNNVNKPPVKNFISFSSDNNDQLTTESRCMKFCKL